MIAVKLFQRSILTMLIFSFIAVWSADGRTHPYYPGSKQKNPSLLFDFHSGFWINLHHFIYYQAYLKSPESKPEPSKLKDTIALNMLDEAQRSSWDAAINYYKEKLINRDLLLDTGMVTLKNILEDRENDVVLIDQRLPMALKTILNNVSKSYKTLFWAKQDQINQQWIAGLRPLLQQNISIIAKELEDVYQTAWPDSVIRVDVTNYASWAGAYTTTLPDRITVSSADPHNQQVAALEIVFHEASHTLIDKIRDKVSAICKQDNKHIPRRDLWHAILFYTTGEVVRKHFAEYEPFAYKNGLWDRAWPMYKSYLEKDWLPYIQHKIPFSEALEKLVRDIEVPV